MLTISDELNSVSSESEWSNANISRQDNVL